MSTSGTLKLVAALLEGQTLGRDEAAKLLGTRVAAADKQLKAVQSCLNVESINRSGKRYYRWKSRQDTPAKALPVSTVLAAYFGASLGRLFDETVYGDGMRNAAEVVRDVSGRAERFEHADRQFVFVKRGGEIAFPDKERDLDEIVRILLDSNEARFRYRAGNGKIATAVVQPLSIAIYDHQLYIIARRRDGSFHPFRFARIEQVTRLNQRFSYPTRDEYDPEQVFRDSIGVYVGDKFPVKRIAVRLRPKWARYTKTHRWHPSQEPLGGTGKDELRLTVRVCPELLRWVLGFGADAVVVKPRLLRRRVEVAVRRMADLYGVSARSARAR